MAGSKVKAGKASQSKRFIEAARDAECSEDEAVFDANLERLAGTEPSKTTPKPEK
jgi:hypothetical protein